MKVTLLGKPQVIMSNPFSKYRYFGWPTVARLKNGKIAVVASGYRFHHLCPFGKTVISYSENEGETYTVPAPVFDTVLDDRDGGIVPFGESGVLVTSFNNTVAQQKEWALNETIVKSEEERTFRLSYLNQITKEEETAALGSSFRISRDNGVTFGPPIKIPVTNPHGPAVLPDGSFLWVGNVFGNGELPLAVYRIQADGTAEKRGEIEPIVYQEAPRKSFEPHAFVLEDGTILVHFRVEEAMFTVYQTQSTDGGYTWSKPRKLLHDFGGSPPHIFRHSSGVLISTYGFRGVEWKAPFGVRAMFSRDNGVTWDVDHDLYLTDISPDLGYPSTIELKDGSLLTVFYGAETPDGPPVIWQQKWRIEECI